VSASPVEVACPIYSAANSFKTIDIGSRKVNQSRLRRPRQLGDDSLYSNVPDTIEDQISTRLEAPGNS